MVDNFDFTEGSGKTGAAKDIGGVLHPLVIATEADGSDTGLAAKLGSLTETAPATDTASSGLNGRLQRIAQRITSLIALLPTALTGSGNFKAAISEDAVGLAKESGGNLATIAGAVSSAKMAVKASSGDFADGSDATIGTKADAKSTATDVTAVSAMSVWKQISASVQAMAASLAGTLTVASHNVTNAGTFAVQATEADGANTTLGAKADAKSSATDTTAITVMSVLKQISFSIQAAAASLAGSLTVGSISTSVTPGTAAANLGKAEDAAHSSGDTGVMMLAVRTDTPATTSSTTGDYDALHTGAEGGMQVNHIASAKTGMSRQRVAAAASTNATSVKASAGVVWGFELFNNTSSAKFFKLYNKASAPTVGTDTPVETIIIPANGGAVAHMRGDEFSTGIAFAITGAVADSDTTAVAANDVHGVLLYK